MSPGKGVRINNKRGELIFEGNLHLTADELDFPDAVLEGMALQGIRFEDANMEGANLRGADL
jgi:uncharacterized protein YjbI with pentapeptide repeats